MFDKTKNWDMDGNERVENVINNKSDPSQIFCIFLLIIVETQLNNKLSRLIMKTLILQINFRLLHKYILI